VVTRHAAVSVRCSVLAAPAAILIAVLSPDSPVGSRMLALPESAPPTAPSARHQPDAPGSRSDTIRIDGSNGVMPLVAALAESFMRQSPGSTVRMGGGLGSGARLRALKQGEIDIAIASHGLDLAALRRDGFAAHRIARTAVVFGVNAAVRAPGLSSAQVCEILAGRVTAWDRVEGTGSRRPLVAIARDESEVDMEVVRAGIPCLAGASVGSIVRIVPDTESMRRALLADSGAFGVTTMTVVVQSGGQIRAIALDGVAPTNSKVADKRYPLVRASYLITSAKPTAAVQQFLNFVRSAKGGAVLRENGSVPE